MNPALLVNVIFVLVIAIASPGARSQPLRPNGNHSDLPGSISFAVSEVHEVAPIAEAATDAVPEIAVVEEVVVVPETEQVVVVPEPKAVVEQVVVTEKPAAVDELTPPVVSIAEVKPEVKFCWFGGKCINNF